MQALQEVMELNKIEQTEFMDKGFHYNTIGDFFVALNFYILMTPGCLEVEQFSAR